MFDEDVVFCPHCGSECGFVKLKIDCETCDQLFDIPEHEPDLDWLEFLEEKITEEWREAHGY